MMNVAGSYPISMSGIHGSGKATLRDGVARRYDRCEGIDFHLLELGRKVDVAGLSTFRDRYLEQDGLVRQAIERGRLPVTSRLGILDVAIVASVMAAMGRLPEDDVRSFLERLADDLPAVLFPRTLAAVVCEPTTLLRRLAERDEARGRTPPRGVKVLSEMATRLEEIYVLGRYPHPLIAGIVELYRGSGSLVVVDTSKLDAAEALALVVRFLEESKALATGLAPGGREG
jgi:hypothetical protein